MSGFTLLQCAWDQHNLDVNAEFYKVNWNEGGRVHNWKTYIPDAIKENWDDLSTEAMLAAYLVAKQMADREEWD